MDYTETRDIVEDICMSYGFKLNEYIDFDRWMPEDVKTVKDFLELQDEQRFEAWYNDQNGLV